MDYEDLSRVTGYAPQIFRALEDGTQHGSLHIYSHYAEAVGCVLTAEVVSAK